MKNMFRLIVLVLLLGGWTLAAFSLHVIRDGGRIVVIPKQSLSYQDIYVDSTKWTLDDVARHPAVVNRLIQNGKADLLQHVAPNASGDALHVELKSAIERGPQVKPAQTTQPSDAPQSNA